MVDRGLRSQKWFDDVEGTYMRLDIPHIMPHLLAQLEDRKLGEQLLLHMHSNCCIKLTCVCMFMLLVCQSVVMSLKSHGVYCMFAAGQDSQA